MIKDLFSLVSKTNAYRALLQRKGHFVVNSETGVSLLFATLFRENTANYALITSNLYNARKLADSLAAMLGEENVLLFPSDDVLRSELLATSKELLAQRLFVMGEALKKEKKILVLHSSSLMMPLPDIETFKQSILHIKIGDILDLEDIKRTLVESGYLKVNRLDQSLQFASRGDILDIYSVNYPNPIRIELFDNEVESIAFFDIATQTSQSHLEEITIYPANQYLLNDDEISLFKNKTIRELNKINNDDLKDKTFEDIDLMEAKQYHPRLAKYYLSAKENACSILDYFQSDLTFIVNEKQFEIASDFADQEAYHYLKQESDNKRLLPNLSLYLDRKEIFLKQNHVLKSDTFQADDSDVIFDLRPIIFSNTNISNLPQLIKSYLSLNDILVLSLANNKQLDIITSLLKENHLEYEILEGYHLPKKTKLGITLSPLSEGFEFPEYKLSYISSNELFGRHNRPSQYFKHFKEGTILRSYEDLKPGDYVVHEQYGIGQFVKIDTIEAGGVYRDFIILQYARGGELFIPLAQFRLIRKYAGREGASPRLSSLNGNDWEKTKSKIRERINVLADRLYRLYAERVQVPGFAFEKDDEFQLQFENEFPYELTEDQKRSLNEIKRDMESPKVMDRLLCGDVGFGKTEVAFRAAFKAILAGKQVALLCPTTLLARQHYERALERFSNFGAHLAVLSRLVPESKAKLVIKGINDGTIDFVIGTHKLLSKNIKFKNLGLLIVDEEQRFGVEQKEKIKELKTDVDVLSLSATPIPRTLQLSLVGMRDVSQIKTAPDERSPIQTYVMPYDFAVAKELIERELERKGQVFYVHNIVMSINTTADKIQRAIPTAKVAIIHGQMPKDEVEDTMMKFYQGDIDVLVATSIIENGIDIPNANLILIEDADKFGLAQLYQIKGRVGRGDRVAYAYLFYRKEKNIRKDAVKRLKAIQDFVELGSGLKIAQRDLMIRGAGDMLGPEQAGFIDSIGLELYLKMLNEVIEEKKSGYVPLPAKPIKVFDLDAYLPKEYISDEDKIEWYQEIEHAENNKKLKEIKSKMRDVYGRLPKEVEMLFQKRALDIILEGPAFEEITEFENVITITTSKTFSDLTGVGVLLFEKLATLADKIRLTYVNRVLKIKFKKEEDWFKTLNVIVKAIQDSYNECIKMKDEQNEN